MEYTGRKAQKRATLRLWPCSRKRGQPWPCSESFWATAQDGATKATSRCRVHSQTAVRLLNSAGRTHPAHPQAYQGSQRAARVKDSHRETVLFPSVLLTVCGPGHSSLTTTGDLLDMRTLGPPRPLKSGTLGGRGVFTSPSGHSEAG